MSLLNFFFPKFCKVCGDTGYYLCPKCISAGLSINYQQECHVCGNKCFIGLVHKECKDLSFLDGVIYFARYNNLVRNLIFEGKYSFTGEIFEELALRLIKILKAYNVSKFVITSVPLEKTRFNWRGFNQTKIISNVISKYLNIPEIDLLTRSEFKRSQIGLGRIGRKDNLVNVFKSRYSQNLPNKVLIVDDVFTTGATLNTCAKILKENGVEEVVGLVIARR